ncbi:NRDE family protein [Myxococcota bacterium]|nr:NRDE family protein [Myxococcota bacterium]
MCTLALLHRVRDDLPLLVAANRDEFLARPAAPPGVLDAEAGLFGPRDLSAGGTWIAANRSGVLAGLTNRPPPRSATGQALPDAATAAEVRDPRLRSRGEVIPRLLTNARTAAEAAEAAALLPADAYNPFYLLIADGRDAFAATCRGGRCELAALGPGLHVLENGPVDDPESVKVARVRARLEGAEGWPLSGLPLRLLGALADHALPDAPSGRRPPPLDALCVHTPVYGTRSSSVVGLGPGNRLWWHAEGPPCVTPGTDCSSALARA